uniref:Uncharacterized protein n=1 Tax=Hyaloperonospora arabidopsidis (strain Emoy2) TaxID=559515 RepID=M4B4V3_HYAAE
MHCSQVAKVAGRRRTGGERKSFERLRTEETVEVTRTCAKERGGAAGLSRRLVDG